MNRIAIIIDTRAAKDGKPAPVKLRITHKRVTVLVSTSVKVAPQQFSAGKVVAHKHAAALNALITQAAAMAQQRVIDLAMEGRLPLLSPSELAKDLRHLIEYKTPGAEDTPRTFADALEEFKETKTGRTKEIYAATANALAKFRDLAALRFTDITPQFLDAFDAFLATTAKSVNARNVHFRNIRAVFNHAIRYGYTDHYPFKQYQIKNKPTRKRSLQADTLRSIFGMKPASPREAFFLDMFRLSFCLIGINNVDLAYLPFCDGRANYTRRKTGKQYSVRIEPEAQEILDKWKGTEYALPILDRYSDYRAYTKALNKEINAAIKRNGIQAPDISSYWLRHSWATIAAELDIPKETIAAALGHDIGNEVTSIYIRFDQGKIDEANRKVLDKVFGKE